VNAQLDKKQLSWTMSSQILYRFGYKNWEMTGTESARIFLNSKEGKNLNYDQPIYLEKIIQGTGDRF
jgi:hypothetical protein